MKAHFQRASFCEVRNEQDFLSLFPPFAGLNVLAQGVSAITYLLWN